MLKKALLSTCCTWLMFAAVTVSGTAFSTPAYAVNTAQIVASAANLSCAEWQVVGVCFWLRCNPKCKVRTSVKVKHYIPEVVVSSYAGALGNPWVEMAAVGAPNPLAQGGGNLLTPNTKRDNQPRFKHVDVIGHPATYATLAASFSGYTCSSSTNGFVPYYVSNLDTPAWRWGITEALYPQSLIPGLREVSKGLLNNWGSVYPRQGFLVQGDDGKAGAVMAQRAADFVVRRNQPHVYNSIHAWPRHFSGWWPPGYYEDPLKEGDMATHKWQQLHPSISNFCFVFPTISLVEQDEQGGYAYALWRPYRCCDPKGLFLFSIGQ